MSSLAAARADNFYYPPEYRAEHGSLNQFRGSHPLGQRANKIHEGILVIRFEMPFKVFCNKCNEVIAKGVRFNAEKKTVGQYFTTKILEFSMKCCFCDNTLRIRTDPKTCEYIPTEGLRRKVETFTPEDAETLEYRSAAESQALDNDPLLKLETTAEDLSKAQQSHQQIEQLIALNESRHSPDVQYDLNLKLRKRFREWKKEEIVRENEEKKPLNFAVPLGLEDPMDVREAASVNFCTNTGRLDRRIKQSILEASSIFYRRQSKRLCAAQSSHCRESTKPSSHCRESTKPSSNPPRLVPCADHKALSLVIPAVQSRAAVPSPTQSLAPRQEKRLRLTGNLERIKSVRRNASRAAALAQRNGNYNVS